MDSARKKAAAGKDREALTALLALIGALVVALLLAANVQLADMGETGHPTSAVGESPSSLPPPVTGTSNDVLSEELRGMTNSLRRQLGPLGGLTEGQADAATAFENVADSVQGLGSLQGEITHLGSGLNSVVGNTGAMTDRLGGTNTTIAAMAEGIGATTKATNGMLEATRQVQDAIEATGKSTNESMLGVSSGIKAMRESILAMSASLTNSSSEIKAMGQSMTELNANMEQFLSLLCTLLTSESCEEGTA